MTRARLASFLSWKNVARHGALVALVIVVGTMYGRTLLPGLHEFGDVTKAQFLGRLLGMTHPTGYPLYILATAPLSRIPLGTLALRINAFSALMGLGAVVLVYLVLRRLSVRALVALPVALAFAWSRTSWEQFVIAEVYALGAFLVALVFYLLAVWLETARSGWFLAAAAVYALSFGNHLTVVTLLPAFVTATLVGPWRRLPRLRTALWVALFVLLGMVQYGYLFWASASDSPYLEYRVRDFSEFVDYVSGAQYRGRMFAFGPREVLLERLPRFVRLLLRDLGWIAWLAPLGLAWALLRRSRAVAFRVALVLSIGGLGQLVWLLGYDIPDIDVYAIPLLLIVALFAGLGAESLLSWLLALRAPVGTLEAGAPRTGSWAARIAELGFVAVLLAFVVPLALAHAPSHRKARAFTRHMDRELATLGQGAIVVGAIHYGPRMALIERFYAEGLSQSRDLHLAPMATPKEVARYLKGKGTLRDSSLRTRLSPGRRVFLHERGRQVDYGPQIRKVRRGTVWELLLKPGAGGSSLRKRRSP